MVFGLFKKYCTICGREVNENNEVRFGKHFCSEEHAEEYVNEQKKIERLEMQMMDRKPKSSGKCGCG